MKDMPASNFNIIVRNIIKKSLLTERQVEIIVDLVEGRKAALPISRGAYYRQRSQVKRKIEALYYSMVLVYGLGALPKESLSTIGEMSEQLSVIFDSDVGEEVGEEVFDVMGKAVKATINV